MSMHGFATRPTLGCRSKHVTRTRICVARPVSSVPAEKGSVAVQPSTNGPSNSNEYIAGPYGSGRLSLDGELLYCCMQLALAVMKVM